LLAFAAAFSSNIQNEIFMNVYLLIFAFFYWLHDFHCRLLLTPLHAAGECRQWCGVSAFMNFNEVGTCVLAAVCVASGEKMEQRSGVFKVATVAPQQLVQVACWARCLYLALLGAMHGWVWRPCSALIMRNKFWRHWCLIA
jgi:hypothetical protein